MITELINAPKLTHMVLPHSAGLAVAVGVGELFYSIWEPRQQDQARAGGHLSQPLL